jgi:hypothetical protein
MTRLLRTFLIFGGIFALLTSSGNALAHKPSDSYLSLRAEGNRLSGQWDIALRDLEFAIGLDDDEDGELTWGEVKAKREAIAAYALARLHVRQGNESCPLDPGELLIDEHTDGVYAVIPLSGECRQASESLHIDYRLFFDVDAQHKGLLKLERGEEGKSGVQSAVFAHDQPERRFVLAEKSAFRHFGDYLVEGIFHIWIGIDHILFLVSLLLPAVLIRQAGKASLRASWRGAESFRPAFWEVLKVVTAFTVAHTITLTLATLGLVQLPSRLVESVIALSVVLAALNNLAPLVGHGRWIVAFVFGLIHGFGFASVLADLGLPDSALVVALLGFNLGVETGQLAIVAVVLPISFRLRHGGFYRLFVLRGGSLLIVGIAAAWFVERAFNMKLLPF